MGLLLILLPLFASFFIWVFKSKLPTPFAGIIAASSVFVSFLFGLWSLNYIHHHGTLSVVLGEWIRTDRFVFSFSFLFDSLSVLMILMITGIGSLIHVYAIGYMKDDERFNSFFAYLSLFVFFMLVLVLSDNYLGMLIGWEGVGLCSYLLIGFWYENQAYNDAAKKAFLMNRIGDVGFILAILMLLITFGSVSFSTVFAKAGLLLPGVPAISIIAMCLLIGAIGKSAQFPLYTWLPDAMAGPTPVSALIHAATMVTAGVYMISRSNILFVLSPFILKIILVIGIITALVGGIVAIFQSDIKKILAYSTVSQLGMMVIALGLGSFHVALFHMLMHAFFKALLFLNAGTIIHALHGEQNAFKMGGLKRNLPFTFWTTLVGTLAIVGCPPFSGAMSKESLLLTALEHNVYVFWILIFISLLTAFYMFRFLHLVFLGNARHSHHFHFPAFVMQWPVFVLAVLSTIGGALNLPEILHGTQRFDRFLSDVLPIFFSSVHNSKFIVMEWVLMLATPVVLYGIWVITQQLYATKHPVESQKPPVFLDTAYKFLIVYPYLFVSNFLSRFVEPKCIEGGVKILVLTVSGGGKFLQKFQTGKIGFYMMLIVMALLGFMFYQIGWL